MRKTIGVWGSPGSGKSLVSLALAHALNQQNHKVIIVSLNKTTPMFSTCLPYKECNRKNDSAGIMLNGQISLDTLRGRLHYNESNKNTAFLTLCTGDTLQAYPDNWPSVKLEQLFVLLSSYCDYIILDLSSNFLLDNVSLFGLAYCDNIVRLVTPDNNGISFMESYLPLIADDNRFQCEKHITAVSNAYEYSAYEQVQRDHEIKILLPHSRDVYSRYVAADGNMLKVGDRQGILFVRAIKQIAEEISHD